MTEDEALQRLLRRAVPAVKAERSARDLWPDVVEHLDARPRWSRVDIGLAVAVATALAASPDALWLLAYHL